MSTQLADISLTLESMSVFQRLGGTIFLIMVLTFFLWILYLIVTK